MRVAVSGSNGFVGSRLVTSLAREGHEALRLVRQKKGASEREIVFNSEDDLFEREACSGVDAVVHLAGENIAERWTSRKRDAIRRSRGKGTRFLSEVLASLPEPPRVLVSASAIGIYGDRGDELLSEDSTPGTGFLAEVCREWEEATRPAAEAGIRVVNLRIGIVLDPQGGMLRKILPAFRFGLGGRLGSGRQYMSWISLDDAVGIIMASLLCDSLSGPVNAVSPAPVTNREFTRALARSLSRPAFFPLPKVILEAAFGDMAREMLLVSQRVSPRRLMLHEFRFQDPSLTAALDRLLRR